MYNIVKGNQTANSAAYKEIIKDFPHMEDIMVKFLAPTKYGIGNIWDSEKRIVFYFYQSMVVNFHDMEVLTMMNKYDVSIQVNMGDDYKFNISIDKVSKIDKVIPQLKRPNSGMKPIKREFRFDV